MQRLVQGLLSLSQATLEIELKASCSNEALDDKIRARCRTLQERSEAIIALTHADIAAALTSIRLLAGLASNNYKKAFAVMTAIARYAVLAKERAAPEVVAGARDEVESSLLALLDNALSRSERAGDWIFGAGVGVQFRGGTREAPGGAAGFAALGLPVSFSATREIGDGCGVKGFQVLAIPVDLGNYASSRAENWRDILQVAIGASAHFVDRDYPLTLGATIGWRPTFGDSDGPGAFLTFDVGGYIPVLDFN